FCAATTGGNNKLTFGQGTVLSVIP
nr:T cell antigen receptor alpha chain CDR3 region=TCR V alpha 2.2 product [mice, C57BL/6, B16 murine melanoma cells, tumor-infiltrating lymphocytes, Peptide Partial, 24 aa] [Mus sp.]